MPMFPSGFVKIKMEEDYEHLMIDKPLSCEDNATGVTKYAALHIPLKDYSLFYIYVFIFY